ncbi:MAG: PHP domain-containing protein [Desulfamplus sp.]|nr:PHP domain-containing protein [Desulfamplus sp.]MBF0411782.1 PHP domain-containing protein [Desulfamplus sp.]
MKKDIYADMHNHTTASDGDFSPEQLVQKIKALGIAVVGITDHDTDKGLEVALSEGDRIGVKVLPGVEISVRFKEDFFTGTLHLLCYFHPEMLKDSDFRDSLHNTLRKGRGDHLVRARVKEINKFFGQKSVIKNPTLKRDLSFEDVASYSPTVTRRHFALALTEKHHIKNPDIVNQIIGNDSPAYLPSGVDIESIKQFFESISHAAFEQDMLSSKRKNQLKSTGHLMMVLAHPAAGSFPGGGHYKEVHPPIEIVEKLLPRFIDAGIRGLEINYPGHIQKHREILHQWAKKYNLVMTGGSDCHDAFIRPPGVEGIKEEEFDKFMIGMRQDD